VDALLSVHQKYSDMLANGFKGDSGFGASLDKVGYTRLNGSHIMPFLFKDTLGVSRICEPQ
jgi:hypothetical protein